MLRTLSRKLLPTIILLGLIIWFLYPEIIVVSRLILNKIQNECLIENIEKKGCDKLIISAYSPSPISLGLTNPATFRFSVNRNIRDIDLQKSNIVFYADPNSSISEEQVESNINISIVPQIISRYSLNDGDVEMKDSGQSTLITAINKKNTFLDGTMLYVHINIFDKNGRNSLSSSIASTYTTSKDVFLNNYSSLLLYLAWYFAIFGVSLKAVSWSVVYDSKTKNPISRAIVRIFCKGKLIQTVVTGQTGVISTKLDKGEYTIKVIHPNYIFPSKLLTSKNDGEYKAIYRGEIFEVFENGKTLRINMPMDPKDQKARTDLLESTKNTMLYMVDTFNPLFIVLVTFGQVLLFANILETWTSFAVSILLVVIQQLIRGKERKTPGIVVDEQGTPLPNIKVDLYEKEWKKLVESKVTDDEGVYEFIVVNKKYYIKIENSEYNIEGLNEDNQLEINETSPNSKTAYINQKIVLRRN